MSDNTVTGALRLSCAKAFGAGRFNEPTIAASDPVAKTPVGVVTLAGVPADEQPTSSDSRTTIKDVLADCCIADVTPNAGVKWRRSRPP